MKGTASGTLFKSLYTCVLACAYLHALHAYTCVLQDPSTRHRRDAPTWYSSVPSSVAVGTTVLHSARASRNSTAACPSPGAPAAGAPGGARARRRASASTAARRRLSRATCVAGARRVGAWPLRRWVGFPAQGPVRGRPRACRACLAVRAFARAARARCARAAAAAAPHRVGRVVGHVRHAALRRHERRRPAAPRPRGGRGGAADRIRRLGRGGRGRVAVEAAADGGEHEPHHVLREGAGLV